MSKKTAVFYGGPFHEQDLELEAAGGILPAICILPLPDHNVISKRYSQKFAHYQLRNIKHTFGYFLIGYSKDRGVLSILPGLKHT